MFKCAVAWHQKWNEFSFSERCKNAKNREKDEVKRNTEKKRDAKTQNYVCWVPGQYVCLIYIFTSKYMYAHAKSCTHANKCSQLVFFTRNIKLISNLLSIANTFFLLFLLCALFLFNHLVVCWNCVLNPYWAIFKNKDIKKSCF